MDFFQSSPLSEQQQDAYKKLASSLSETQFAWLSGFMSGVIVTQSTGEAIQSVEQEQNNIASDAKPLTILYGSRTGNGELLAKLAFDFSKQLGIKPSLKSMEDYNPRDLSKEQALLVIVSTHGEGEPPFAAKAVYDFLFGKRAQKLEQLSYAVLGLGDRSYAKFCQTAIDFDEKLLELGANRVQESLLADLDFKTAAETWLKELLPKFGGPSTSQQVLTSPALAANAYSAEKPFVAEVYDGVDLHSEESDRSTYHVELSCEIPYQPGDSLGVIFKNDTEAVREVIAAAKLSAEEKVVVNGAETTLSEALTTQFEISKITRDVLTRYQEKVEQEELSQLLSSEDDVLSFLYVSDLSDVLLKFPYAWKAQEFVDILRPISPRLYSISSSPLAYPDEVHLTVSIVEYEQNNRTHKGACSNYLKYAVENDEVSLNIFVEDNPNFRLPENEETPIIMIGAGTGVAPYRAFMQHRQSKESTGKNWLFFGNRHFESEFLYQAEWLRLLKEGVLTNLDVAFSRDTDKKVYVQDKLIENKEEIYRWIEEGAYIYICGDRKKMAVDVQNALAEIIASAKSISTEDAEEYLYDLQKQKRLQLDVY